MSELNLSMLQQLAEKMDDDTDTDSNDTSSMLEGNKSENLRKASAAMQDLYQFVPGDLIQWKPMLQNRIQPAYGEPVVVIEALTEPLIDSSNDSGSPYFREPLDIVVGELDSDDDFLLWHLDSRRMEHFKIS